MGFCGWPVTIPAELADEWALFPPDAQEVAVQAAGRILWTLTGQVFGVCEETVRPCFQPHRGTTYQGGAFWPGMLAGDPTAAGPCGCSPDCSEVGYDRVSLVGPVADVVEVRIDGALVDPAAYRVLNRRWLHRVDGQRWPTHQDLHAADGDVGAFTIRYMRGLAIPVDGLAAGGRLAVEFARGAAGSGCSLPAGVTSVSRQGISVELADMREWFTNGVTGVESVDLWIMSVNPFKSKRPGRVTSPDRRRMIRGGA